jgi:hypothetical protein
MTCLPFASKSLRSNKFVKCYEKLVIIGKLGRTMDSSVTVELLLVVRDAQSTPGNDILLSINSPSSMQRDTHYNHYELSYLV